MKIIRDYIEVLFLQVPISEQTNQVKEDLIANSEDYYFALIEEGKSEKEALGIVISEFGTLDEILAVLGISEEERKTSPVAEDFLMDDALEYWQESRKFAFNLSFGFLIGFASLAIVPFWGSGNGGVLTTLSALLTCLLALISLLFIFISYKEQRQRIKEIKKRTISEKVRVLAFEKMEDYHRSYQFSLCLSFISYGMSIPVLFILIELFYLPIAGVVFFFALCGLGTFLLLYASIIQREYKRLSKNKQRRKIKWWHRLKYDEEIYWVIVTIFYFLISFMFRAWLYSWLVFLVGYVIAEILMKNKATSTSN